MAQNLKNPKSTKLPLVSVVMSAYNAEKYIKEAIDSILDQTFTNFEFIIINDGSTDDTLKIIKSYKDPRIVLISQENKGLVVSLNEGIERARGKYIARMDADDISMPERFEKQVEYLESHPEIDLVGSQIQTFNTSGDKIIIYKPITSYEIYYLLAYGSIMAHPSVVMKRDAVISAGLYRQEFWPAEDYDLWSRLIKKNNTYNLPEILLKYRVDTHSVSSMNIELQAKQTKAVSIRIQNNIYGLSKLSLYVKLLYLQKKGRKFLPKYSTLDCINGLANGYIHSTKSKNRSVSDMLRSVKIRILVKLSRVVFYEKP